MRVLAVGHCTLDYLAIVDRFLEPDGKKEMLQFSQQGGGSAATAAVALARWGVATRFLGKAGDDDRGRRIHRTIQDEGVDASKFVFQPGAVSQMSFIVIEQGSGRKQTHFTQGNVDPLASSEIPADLLDGVDWLLVDGTHPDAELPLMREAKSRGVKVLLDAQSNTGSIQEAVAHCDVLVASERFASQFAGVGELKELCNTLLGKRPSTVVVTLGIDGCVAMTSADRSIVRLDAFDVPVVDTTGAGDVFHGAILYGLVHGWDLKKQVEFANVAAGLTCRGVGGRGAIPTLEEILTHLD